MRVLDNQTASLGDLHPDVRTEILSKIFWALGQPVRIRILQILHEEGEQAFGDLVERVPVSQPQVSAHLASLTECGFTKVRREGRRSHYRIDSPWVAGLLSLARDHADTYCAQLLHCIGCDPTQAARSASGDESTPPATA